MKLLLKCICLLLSACLSPLTQAEVPLEVQKITENVYAIVGELVQRRPENLANNSTHGVVVTDEGVLLIDPGGSYKGAEQLDRAIRTITDKPVKLVINSGGQDHRWLGNSYFKAKGARIIAAEATVADQRSRTNDHFFRLGQLLGKALEGTDEYYTDETFEERMNLKFGGFDFELIYAGPAHTDGDIFIWMPQQSVMFTGDIVFTERALGTGPAQNTASWVKVLEEMMSYKPKHIIPGHGHATTLERAKADTYDYLIFLRQEIGKLIENDGDVLEAVKIDQSRFSYLEVFEQIAGRNAQAVFTQMEFE